MATTSRLLHSLPLLLALAACDRRDPTAPLAPAGPRRALDFDTAQLSRDGYELVKVFNVPVKIDDASVPWTSTGVTLAAGEYAYVVPEGEVRFRLNDTGWEICAQEYHWYCGKISGVAGPYGGVGGPSGAYDAELRLFYRVSGSGSHEQILAHPAAPKGPGTIEIMRNGARDPWDYSGTQTVQIWRLRGAQPPPCAAAATASTATCQQEPRIQLACTPNPVIRGESIRCTASKAPTDAPGELKITGWSFEGRARTDGDLTSTEWTGVVVRGGTVVVTGGIGASRVSQDSATIQITPRRWRRLKAEVHDDGHGDLPEPEGVNSPGDLAHTHFLAPASYDTARVRSGPNAGWQYLKSLPDTVTTVVHISKAFKRASAWYVLQTGGRKRDPATGRILGDYCRGSDIPTIERLTREHEGILSSTSSVSHIDVLKDWFRANSPADSLEAAVAFVGDGGGEVFDDLLQAKFYEHVTRAALEDDPNQRHTNDREKPGRVEPAPFPCYLRPWN